MTGEVEALDAAAELVRGDARVALSGVEVFVPEQLLDQRVRRLVDLVADRCLLRRIALRLDELGMASVGSATSGA